MSKSGIETAAARVEAGIVEAQPVMEVVAEPPEPTPADSIETRLRAGIVTHDDVESVKDQLSPDEYAELRGVAEMQDTQRAHLEREHGKIAAQIPEWSDPAMRSQIQRELYAYGVEQGYTPQQLAQVTDAREVIRAIKAIRHGKPSAPAARSRGPRELTGEARRRIQRAAQTGRALDAARVFEALLPDD